MEEHSNKSGSIKLPLYVGIALAFGLLLGTQFSSENKLSKPSASQSTIAKFKQVVGYIQKDYVDEVETDKLVESAIEKMLEELDPHTVYISSEDLKLTEGDLKGNFEGIGVEFNIFNDTINVISPLSGGPSEKLGIRPGDKIVTVDGETVAGIGINNRDVVSKLRGPKGSIVVVEIFRNGEKELLNFNIKRGVIPQYSIEVAYMANPETGYIKVSRFSATTYQEFKKSMDKLLANGMRKLVLDLTGNPGGYMDKAIELVDELLPDNQLIVFTQGKDPRYNENSISRRKGMFEEFPVVVMIDEGSASASEIVAGALQDNDRALIVGRRSYGKGLVQRPLKLVDGSELRLTISRYYTPSGRSIQRPYNGKKSDYNLDFSRRIENGEIFHQDSIQLNDSLLHYTNNGRVVYGGGGIMPDVFVSLDTALNSNFLNRLFISNTIAEYALAYSQTNKENLVKQGLADFIKDFQVSDKMLNEILALAKANRVIFNEAQFAKSKPLLKTYVKAYIARGVWDNEGFYPIFNQQNEIYQRALTLFDDESQLALTQQKLP